MTHFPNSPCSFFSGFTRICSKNPFGVDKMLKRYPLSTPSCTWPGVWHWGQSSAPGEEAGALVVWHDKGFSSLRLSTTRLKRWLSAHWNQGWGSAKEGFSDQAAVSSDPVLRDEEEHVHKLHFNKTQIERSERMQGVSGRYGHLLLTFLRFIYFCQKAWTHLHTHNWFRIFQCLDTYWADYWTDTVFKTQANTGKNRSV